MVIVIIVFSSNRNRNGLLGPVIAPTLPLINVQEKLYQTDSIYDIDKLHSILSLGY